RTLVPLKANGQVLGLIGSLRALLDGIFHTPSGAQDPGDVALPSRRETTTPSSQADPHEPGKGQSSPPTARCGASAHPSRAVAAAPATYSRRSINASASRRENVCVRW